RLRAARHPARDPHAARAARGRTLRGREPVHARRPVGGQRARAGGDGRGVRAAPPLRVARPGLHLAERPQARRRLCRPRRRAPLRRAGRARRRPQGLPVRRGAEGRHQAVGVQGVRHRLHAGAADRDLHGVIGGRVRGVLQLRALRADEGGCVSATGREERILDIIETARAKRPRFRDERVTMAHGAGGKATQSLIEGLLVPAYGSPALATLGDAGLLMVDRTELALTTDAFVVKPLRFPGGSIGELAVNGTVNDLAVAGARPQALTLSLILEEGLDADVLRAEVEAIAAAARAAGVAIVAGDTKVVGRGQADQMYICTTGLGRIDERAALSPAALRPGDRI